MRHFAELFWEDTEKWGIVGLTDDIDYEMYPDQHCIKAREILEENNWPEEYIHAIQSHGFGICCDVKPVEKMEKGIFLVISLFGLATFCCLLFVL